MSTQTIAICHVCAARLREAGFTVTPVKMTPVTAKCGVCGKKRACEVAEVRK